MKTVRRRAMSAAVFAVLGLGTAGAADLPAEGSYDLTSCVSGVFEMIQFSKTVAANNFEQTGAIRNSVPGGFLDLAALRCVGVNSVLDGKATFTTFCQSTDRDGDKMFTRTVAEGAEQRQETLAGTGKYEGIVRTGIGERLSFSSAKPGTYQRCDRLTGTYSLQPARTPLEEWDRRMGEHALGR